jgi:hypothetical protein
MRDSRFLIPCRGTDASRGVLLRDTAWPNNMLDIRKYMYFRNFRRDSHYEHGVYG